MASVPLCPVMYRPLLALALSLLVPALAQAQSTTVRVRLFGAERPSAVEIESAGSPLHVTVDGRGVDLRPPIRARVSGSRVELSAAGRSVSGRSIDVGPGPVIVRDGSRVRAYDGHLALRSDGGRLEIVNHVALPDYVASVVASEYPFREIEGVKAQAVLARTYALRRQNAHPTYDLDDHQGSQVYKGREVVTDVTRAAERETAGQVLTYAGALAETPYSSSSGGHTADNEAVWAGTPLPYLRGVADPYDAASPDHSWQTSGDVDAVHRALSGRFGGTVRGVEVAERSRSGRAVTVRLDGARRASISGEEFRSAVNAALGYRTIRSTLFDVSRRGSRYTFEGRGFGHGVGMSQYGARGQAQAGRSYQEILAHYFVGTTLSTPGGVATPVAVAVARTLPARAPSAGTPRWPTPRREALTASDVAPASAPTEISTPPVRRTYPERRASSDRRTGW